MEKCINCGDRYWYPIPIDMRDYPVGTKITRNADGKLMHATDGDWSFGVIEQCQCDDDGYVTFNYF